MLQGYPQKKNEIKSTIHCQEKKVFHGFHLLFALIFMSMTFGEKLKEMREDSLRLQREFLVVIVEIRELATKGNALTEELIFRRDKLYHQFNKILKDHRKLSNYVTENAVDLSKDYVDPT